MITDATAALQTSDAACSTAKNAAVATAALNAASATFVSRNPVIEKELADIRQLIRDINPSDRSSSICRAANAAVAAHGASETRLSSNR